MSSFCRRSLELGADPTETELGTTVDSADAALEVITMAMHQPQRDEVITLLLDGDLRGRTIVVVDGTHSPDAPIEIVELLAEAAAEAGQPLSLVVATVRPGDGALPGDADRWLEQSEIAATCGCELVEWFVISGDLAWCPRDLLAEPPRWPVPT